MAALAAKLCWWQLQRRRAAPQRPAPQPPSLPSAPPSPLPPPPPGLLPCPHHHRPPPSHHPPRRYLQLLGFQRQNGHCSPMPLASGGDFYLINWCSVQRIAARSRVLNAARAQLLDDIGFDWTGADPLS